MQTMDWNRLIVRITLVIAVIPTVRVRPTAAVTRMLLLFPAHVVAPCAHKWYARKQRLCHARPGIPAPALTPEVAGDMDSQEGHSASSCVHKSTQATMQASC